MAYNITILEEKDYDDYNRFFEENDNVLIEHTLEFKEIIEKNFNYKPIYLIAKKFNRIVGILPLFKAESLFEGTRLISIPYSTSAGVISDEPECVKELVLAAKGLVKDKVRYLEIRQKGELYETVVEGFLVRKNIHNFYLNIEKPIDEIWKNLPKGSVRWGIKKAQKSGLIVESGNSKKDLDNFYSIYLETRKYRGIPAYPYRFFEDIVNLFNKKVKIYTSFYKGKPLASIFLLFNKKEIKYAFGGSTAEKEYLKLQPYHIMFWEAIKDGVNGGYEKFDFSSSTIEQDSFYEFKRKWSDEIKVFSHYFFAYNQKWIPKDKSHSYSLIKKIWKRLPRKVIVKISPFAIKQYA